MGVDRDMDTEKTSWLVNWLSGLLVGWLTEWLVGWLVGYLVGWLVEYLARWPTGCQVGLGFPFYFKGLKIFMEV